MKMKLKKIMRYCYPMVSPTLILFAMSTSAFAAQKCTLSIRWSGRAEKVIPRFQTELQKKGYDIVENHGTFTLENGRCLGTGCDLTEASLLQGQPPFLKVVMEVRRPDPEKTLDSHRAVAMQAAWELLDRMPNCSSL